MSELPAATSTELLVIGGGATGLGIAWDASLRGLKTLLVEQSDLGEGTSGRYHGLLHSGGRYVVSDPPTARECIAENRVLREIAASAIENTSGFFLQTPADPGDFVETWARAAAQAGLRHQEVQAAEVLRREPNLTPSILRAFETNDAALDSFDLLHLLQKAIESAGGGVYLHTRVTDFIFDGDRICGAQALSLSDQTSKTIGADLVVNATGPWAAQLTALAGIELPLSLGKGSMLAMSSRLVRSVVNRCRPPGDGDIIVPIGTVSVLGTTDVPVTSPNELRPEPWELDLLLAEAENIIPKIGSHRMLRAWSGIRPLLSNTPSQSQPRERTRAHSVIDHETRDGVPGLITVIGGKLTTFRLMAEETVDVVCDHLSLSTPCSTAETCLPESPRGYFQLPDRLPALAPGEPLRDGPELLCECELVTHQEALDSLETQPDSSIDDLRRDHRLGMGPCQGGYCTLRAAAAMADPTSPHTASQALTGFLHERWRGIRDLPWGHSLRQIEHNRRINLELLAAHSPVEAR